MCPLALVRLTLADTFCPFLQVYSGMELDPDPLPETTWA